MAGLASFGLAGCKVDAYITNVFHILRGIFVATLADLINSEALVTVLTGTAGVGFGAVIKAWSMGKRVDKVDAVAAIAAAFKQVIAGIEAQQKDQKEEIARLRADIIRKDAMYERLMEKLVTIQTIPTTPGASTRNINNRRGDDK